MPFCKTPSLANQWKENMDKGEVNHVGWRLVKDEACPDDQKSRGTEWKYTNQAWEGLHKVGEILLLTVRLQEGSPYQ